jgi:hypothetical protein
MSNPNRSVNAANQTKRFHNRVQAILNHLPRYWIKGGASRLARDVAVSKSTISHLIRGKSHPLYGTASRLVKCLERELGFPLNPNEVFSDDGTYPTEFVCTLAGCNKGYGCSPEHCYQPDSSENLLLRRIQRGQWTGDNFEFEFLTKEERRT